MYDLPTGKPAGKSVPLWSEEQSVYSGGRELMSARLLRGQAVGHNPYALPFCYKPDATSSALPRDTFDLSHLTFYDSMVHLASPYRAEALSR